MYPFYSGGWILGGITGYAPGIEPFDTRHH